MFDLNDEKEFGGSSIFNDGVAGLVKNVEISVEKKDPSTQANTPNYKLFIGDSKGKINEGFYYWSPNTQKTEEQNKKSERTAVSRVRSIAVAVLGKDFVFPAVSSSKEAYDVLFKLIGDNAKGKLFNVYANYGNRGYVKQFMGLRFFNFIEPAGTEPTTLRPNEDDILERIVPDAGSGEVVEENWLDQV